MVAVSPIRIARLAFTHNFILWMSVLVSSHLFLGFTLAVTILEDWKIWFVVKPWVLGTQKKYLFFFQIYSAILN